MLKKQTKTNIIQKCTIDSNNKNLPKHFINDKLYYTDDTYIYESDNLTKAGYIEKGENDETNYILIDDPFILQNI